MEGAPNRAAAGTVSITVVRLPSSLFCRASRPALYVPFEEEFGDARVATPTSPRPYDRWNGGVGICESLVGFHPNRPKIPRGQALETRAPAFHIQHSANKQSHRIPRRSWNLRGPLL
jgi:hypothetical protein